MIYKDVINTITIIVIALIFIMIAGIFLYKHENCNILEKNPMFFALGIVFASGGASILFNLITKSILPDDLKERINTIKS
jgi:hypothetical protein